MSRGMWNCPDKPIPEGHIRQACFQTLEDAIYLDQPNTPEVRAALEYLEFKSLRPGGFTLYRAWLKNGGEQRFHQAIATIKKHLGM
jgi:hypothetical protein